MRKIVVSIFGVVPASILCFFVLPLSVGAVGEYVDTNDPEALTIIFVCISALIGTTALFFSVERTPNPIIMIGLVFGIVAIFGSGGLSFSSGPWKLFFVGPVIVASFLILEGLVTPSNERRNYDEW